MNVSEANAVNVALQYLLMLYRGDADSIGAHELNQARGAAAALADRAFDRLGGGIRGTDVLEALPEYCADRFVDDDPATGGEVVRYCFRPAGHTDNSPDGRDWHDDVAVVWPVETAEAGGHRG